MWGVLLVQGAIWVAVEVLDIYEQQRAGGGVWHHLALLTGRLIACHGGRSQLF
jgi:hypothetical protein